MRMDALLFVAVVGLVALSGCRGEKPPAQDAAKDLGQQTADIAADTAVVREAQAAVNEVVRNAPDCPAARAAIAEAKARLEEATGKIRTTAGRTSLDTMRQQMSRVEQLCP